MDRIWLWVGFNAFVLAMLALDLGVFHRRAHRVPIREAAIWTAIWVSIALTFNYGIYRFMGPAAGLEFLTGYLIEKALAIDNIFVFVVIFSYFRVPAKYQHRVLFWGILGALIMRGTLIVVGVYLIEHFDWIFYVFGSFLVLTGIRMARKEEHQLDPQANPILRLARRYLPVTPHYEGANFFIRRNEESGIGQTVATPLFVVLILVETTDLIFALDSIPAVFAVTHDPFIVYTSNILAVLGLRALYFLLAGVVERFRFLRFGLAAVLVFVGLKMLGEDLYHVPTEISLLVIVLLVSGSIVLSLAVPSRGTGESRRGASPE